MNPRLEKIFGFVAIPHLVRGLVLMQGIAFLMAMINPGSATEPGFVSFLTLDPARVMSGEIWRLVTFVFVPASMNVFFQLIALYILFIIGEGLESGMGALRVTLFVFLGIASQVAGAFLFGWPGSSWLLTSALFMGFATLYPDIVFRLFFVLPVKVKWLGFLTGAYVLYLFIQFPPLGKVALMLTFVNYGLFFGVPFLRKLGQESKARARREKFSREAEAVRGEDGAFHKCCVCGVTEISDPEREFRVAADGKEYCDLHLPKSEEPGDA